MDELEYFSTYTRYIPTGLTNEVDPIVERSEQVVFTPVHCIEPIKDHNFVRQRYKLLQGQRSATLHSHRDK